MLAVPALPTYVREALADIADALSYVPFVVLAILPPLILFMAFPWGPANSPTYHPIRPATQENP